MVTRENNVTLADIFNHASMDQFDIDEVMRILDDEASDKFYDTPAYRKLYDYFCNTGEMPYGVAKARTGDPDVWILDYLTDMISSSDVLTDIADELANPDDGPWNDLGKQIWEMT